MSETAQPVTYASTEAPALRFDRLSKHFGGTTALSDVSFDVRQGEVHALLGENGAGKSTVIKILAGIHSPDTGSISAFGAPIPAGSAPESVAFIHQDLGLVDSMTVAENVALTTDYPRARTGLISWNAVRAKALEALQAFGAHIDPDAPAESLPAAERSLVAIARALAVGARTLVLDEPTAALPEHDVERLLSVLRELRDSGIAILYVTHRLDEVFRVADRITVLRNGRLIDTVPTSDTDPDAVVEMIVGRRVSTKGRQRQIQDSEVLLSLRSVRVGQIGPVSMDLHRGEIVGLVGLTGAGHHEIGRAIFGIAEIAAGELILEGEPFFPSSPSHAVEGGIGFVSGKRNEESLAPQMTVKENIFPNPGVLDRRPRRYIRPRAELELCRELLIANDVRPADPTVDISTLSGGNQQKVVLARWLGADTRILLLEEPTAGVDVGARSEIYDRLESHSEHGAGVVVISSDFNEVSIVCDRALVFNRGRIVAELPQSELSVERLTHLASADTEAGVP